MHSSPLILLLFVGLSVAGYTLEDDYVSGGNFFDLFSFFTDSDPTGGFVQYVDQGTASSNGYINSSSNSVYIGTDFTNVAGSGGRESVRITSNKAYDSGLVILDLGHMPGGICGTWPAFWMVGPNWPAGGEIDIIEGVNEQSGNDMTLHTNQGCQINNNGGFTGSMVTTDCWVNDPNQSNNAGCQIASSDSSTYGSGFNSNNGGVYAMEYTDSTISVYFFPRGSVPSDITSGSPDPTGWGTPLSYFDGCDVGNYIQKQQIVFDLTFCGQWAGSVWSSGSCASKADSCDAFVQNNPSAFQGAYWLINSLNVYSSDGSTNNNVISTSSSATSIEPVTSAVPSTTSVSVAAVTSSYVAPSSTPLSTTFAISTKSIPLVPSPILSHVPFPPSASASFSAGNATNGTYPTGSGTGTAVSGFFPRPTGSMIVSGSMPGSIIPLTTAGSSVAAASAPSSPPEVTLSATITDEVVVTAVQTVEVSAPSWGHWHHSHHGDGSPSPAAVRRHLRQHKRHGAGRL